LPAWANSDALVKSAPTAKQSEGVAQVHSKPERERPLSPDVGYGCHRYRTYDPASGTYRSYDGRRHSCP
jgi:hypothetical protein